jgi:hypothetical protein
MAVTKHRIEGELADLLDSLQARQPLVSIFEGLQIVLFFPCM